MLQRATKVVKKIVTRNDILRKLSLHLYGQFFESLGPFINLGTPADVCGSWITTMFKILSGGGSVCARYMIVYIHSAYSILINKSVSTLVFFLRSLRLIDKRIILLPQNFLCVCERSPWCKPHQGLRLRNTFSHVSTEVPSRARTLKIPNEIVQIWTLTKKKTTLRKQQWSFYYKITSYVVIPLGSCSKSL